MHIEVEHSPKPDDLPYLRTEEDHIVNIKTTSLDTNRMQRPQIVFRSIGDSTSIDNQVLNEIITKMSPHTTSLAKKPNQNMVPLSKNKPKTFIRSVRNNNYYDKDETKFSLEISPEKLRAGSQLTIQ